MPARVGALVVGCAAHRDQARLYAKQVVAGVSDLQLSPEEEEALRLATSTPADVEPRPARSRPV